MYILVCIYHSCKAEPARLSSKTQLQVIDQYGRVYWTSGTFITANQGAMSLHFAEPAPAISAGLCVLQLPVPHMLLLWTSLLGGNCAFNPSAISIGTKSVWTAYKYRLQTELPKPYWNKSRSCCQWGFPMVFGALWFGHRAVTLVIFRVVQKKKK